MTQTRTRASAGAAWSTTTVQPDGYNRPLTVDGPLAGGADTTALYYDAAGLGTGERDGTGHTVTRDIDHGRGLTRSVRDWNNGSLLVPATDGSDKVTYSSYDSLGRLTSVQLPGDPNPTVTVFYSLTKTGPNWTRRFVQQTDGAWTETWAFMDGLGHPGNPGTRPERWPGGIAHRVRRVPGAALL